MTSTTWENVNAFSAMIVFGDSKPWGGFSNLSLIANARVRTVTVGIGATFDTAQLVLTDAEFGDGMVLHSPVKIVAIAGEGIDAVETTLFRGFAVRNLGRISDSSEEVTVECHGYKWFLSRLASIQGRIYALDGVPGVPASEGSGLSIGGKKLTYEMFRMKNPQASENSEGNILRAEQAIFNQGGIPDCMTRTHSNAQVCWYKPLVDYNELDGVTDVHSVPRDWNGNLWTWATILGHIEYFWIKPYTGAQGKVELSSLDMVRVAARTTSHYPIDFSLEGMNPLQAIDAVVRAMPGRWYWYLQYDAFFGVKIRIKQHGDLDGRIVNLRTCPTGSPTNKMCEVNSNIKTADVTEDATATVKYVMAKGGNVKLVTTVKLIPLWPTYDGKDFIDEADFNKWRTYMFNTDEAEKTQMEEDNPDLISRYKLIYTSYAIPIRGQDFRASIPNLSTLDVRGSMYREYRNYDTDILNYFFDDAHIIRQVSPPNFNRYSDSVKVFMHDDTSNGIYNGDDKIEIKEFKDATGLAGDAKSLDINGQNDSKWINPEDTGIDYEYDSKNGTVTFSEPQFRRQVNLGVDNFSNLLQAIGECSWDGADLTDPDSRNPAFGRADAQTEKDGDEATTSKTITATKTTFRMQSRDVYMTAMFSTDVSTVAGKRATGIYDATAGAPFTEHLEQGDNSLIVHAGAFYPSSWNNKEDTVQYREDLFDGKVTGSRIIKAENFSNYNFLIGSGGEEVQRAVDAYVKNFEQIKKIANVTLPYLEAGYILGDMLFYLQNTNYADLRMSLKEIQWSADGDSDQYETTFQFTNVSEGSSGRPNTVANRRDQVEAILGVRIPYKFRI